MSKNQLLLILVLPWLPFLASAQNNSTCDQLRFVLNALVAKQPEKVIDRNKKIGFLHYASKVNINGFENCRILDAGSGVVHFEAEYAGSDMEDNRKKLKELMSLIAVCLSGKGYMSGSRGNTYMWYKKDNPSGGSITLYDRGNGQFLEIEISGRAVEL